MAGIRVSHVGWLGNPGLADFFPAVARDSGLSVTRKSARTAAVSEVNYWSGRCNRFLPCWRATPHSDACDGIESNIAAIQIVNFADSFSE